MKVWKLCCFFLPVAAVALSAPAFARTHHNFYEASCQDLWPVVKDVVKTSGKYNILSISNEELTVSYQVGSVFAGRMLNSITLVTKEGGCELLVNTGYRGVIHNDADDLKKRVDAAWQKRRAAGGF